MATEYYPIESEADWLQARKQDVTSTETAALFGMSPYSTAYELYHQKQGSLDTEFADSERMQAGRHLEPAIAALVAERFGVKVVPFKVYARDPEQRMGSSFDFQVIGYEHDAASELADHVVQYGTGILEIKNVDFLQHRAKWTEDECPAHIEIQLQHQLELTGYAWGAIVALVGGNKLWVYIRMRDFAVGRAIRHAIRDFWALNAPPPPVMPDDADVIIAMSQFADPDSVLDARDDEELETLVREYQRIGGEIRDLEGIRDTRKAEIFLRIGAASKVVLASGSLSCSQTADTPATVITPEMVGQSYGGRRGYRSMRFTAAKKKAAE